MWDSIWDVPATCPTCGSVDITTSGDPEVESRVFWDCQSCGENGAVDR